MPNLTHKILAAHLVSGNLVPGEEVSIRIDQTLTQDATGTMAYLQFEAMGVPRVKTELSVSYVDHNMLQTDFRNADDHEYLRTVAAKYGVIFSKPGNGICHQVHFERFGRPGRTLLGSDSHTPTSGGLGSLAIGAGGLDVALAMAGVPFTMACPKVLGIKLTGSLRPMVSGKDVILEVLRQITVKGGVGKVLEYHGSGVGSLSVTERGTITNMGAEAGATTSLFPSDERTKEYVRFQGREADWLAIAADDDATYDELIEIDLSSLQPMVARPHSPDNVVAVSAIPDLKVSQVCVGSCTNSSVRDMHVVAALLKGKSVHPEVNMTVTPGSKQVFEMMAADGTLATLIAAGARVLESACGPCIGMGQAPASGSVSVRTFNRNFQGRSGTIDAQVYLVSPETAAATALTGVLKDPRQFADVVSEDVLALPEKALVNDNALLMPPADGSDVIVSRGPNIVPIELTRTLADVITGEVLLKVGDDITTDHIMPAGAKVLPYRSNIPKISEFVFERVDPTFATRAKEKGGGMIVGGKNYGQGSSREHAALAPAYLGITTVIAQSFARIHRANLINFGILPLVFDDAAAMDAVTQGDRLTIEGLHAQLAAGNVVMVKNERTGESFKTHHDLTQRQIDILLAGGLLAYVKMK
ncbi:aconitate hydratase, partial [Patescibacteria group bacterium]|nr:aconitate hydratase [Patescibacteria group bacterium]